MHKITFKIERGEDVTIFAAGGESLLALARKANVAIDAPCSGNGSCGKCRVKLLGGDVGGGRTRHLTDAEAADGWRLACASTVAGDAALLVPDIASAYKNRLKVADLSSPAETAVFLAMQENLAKSGLSWDCGMRSLEHRFDAPTLDDTMPDNERLSRAVASDGVAIPYHVLKNLPDILRDNNFNVRCVVQISTDGAAEILDVLPGGDNTPICGLAVDIGTTTVSGILADLQTGEILAKSSAGNSQIRYGADVINRIIEQGRPGGVDRLQQTVITGTLLPLIDSMCAASNITRERIYRLSVASNTTMNHLLLGINANHLRMEPYIPAFCEPGAIDPSLTGISLAPSAKMTVAPNIGSYVGGDITAGTLASMMWNDPEMSLLIDLGTNGEIVFGNSDFLMACACSAGPAFEGGDISCGMRATDGAIEACAIDERLVPEFTVIGGGKPVGLCGSGLIDVVAELFRTGIINGKGKIVSGFAPAPGSKAASGHIAAPGHAPAPGFETAPEGGRVSRDEYGTGSYTLVFAEDSATGSDIKISEVDIDNFIRAKGAIFSGIMSLLKPLGFTPADIGRVMVAGGIGSGINIMNAIRVGMLPDLRNAGGAAEERYSYIGNSSLSGAYAMLVSSAANAKLHEIARSMTYVELSAQPGYMDEFIAACFLPHTDGRLFPSDGY